VILSRWRSREGDDRKVPQTATLLSHPHLDSFSHSVKIKFVGETKRLSVQRIVRRSQTVDPLRPYTLRVKRDHGGGLWTFEDLHGQLFLAVPSREQNTTWQKANEAARARGDRYR